MEIISTKFAILNFLDLKVGIRHCFSTNIFRYHKQKLAIFSKLAPAFNKGGAW